MSKRHSLALAAVIVAATGFAASAQTPPNPARTVKPGDPNEMICEKLKDTGSRIATRRICLTRAQWADRRLEDRQELERVQVRRGSVSQ